MEGYSGASGDPASLSREDGAIQKFSRFSVLASFGRDVFWWMGWPVVDHWED